MKLIAMIGKESVVRKGYDRIAKEYHASRGKFDHTKELKEFAALLLKNAKVLDVGCARATLASTQMLSYSATLWWKLFLQNIGHSVFKLPISKA
jgi:hypothetical protein